MRISDIPRDETVAFITSHVPPGAHTLEVGAGRGEVAQRLRALRYSVTAIDTDADAVAAARRDEIEIEHVDFLALRADPFDAIVFTRSLHHLNPLTAAVEQACALLRPAGTILIEDFAFDEMDHATAHWLHTELSKLRSDGILNTRVKGFGAEFLSISGDLAAWWKQHHGKHQIHTAVEITAAVERIFQITRRSEAPYLYRYISPMLPDDGNGIRILQAVLLRETSMIERGTIQAIGRRLVAVSDQQTLSIPEMSS